MNCIRYAAFWEARSGNLALIDGSVSSQDFLDGTVGSLADSRRFRSQEKVIHGDHPYQRTFFSDHR
jgi:hypothetical protein